jgi:chemotaxis protein CheZ
MALKQTNKQPCAKISEKPSREAKPKHSAPCGISRLSGHVTEAAEELSAIVEVTASASDRIMGCAEAILDAECENHEDFTALVIEQVTQILETCAFQDLTGQRAARLAESLKKVEARLDRAAKGVCIAHDLPPSREETEREARRRRLILHGPQSARDAVSQDSVDALFSAEGRSQPGRRARRIR